MRGQVDLTVCIYHGGFERDLTSGRVLSESTENIGYRICALFIGRKRKRIVLQRERPEVAAHKTGFEKQILWQLPDKGC